MAARSRRELRLVPLQGGQGEGGRGGGTQNDALRAAGGRAQSPGMLRGRGCSAAPRSPVCRLVPHGSRGNRCGCLLPAHPALPRLEALLPSGEVGRPRGEPPAAGAAVFMVMGNPVRSEMSGGGEEAGARRCWWDAAGALSRSWFSRSASRTQSAAARETACPHHPAQTRFLPASRHNVVPVSVGDDPQWNVRVNESRSLSPNGSCSPGRSQPRLRHARSAAETNQNEKKCLNYTRPEMIEKRESLE